MKKLILSSVILIVAFTPNGKNAFVRSCPAGKL